MRDNQALQSGLAPHTPKVGEPLIIKLTPISGPAPGDTGQRDPYFAALARAQENAQASAAELTKPTRILEREKFSTDWRLISPEEAKTAIDYTNRFLAKLNIDRFAFQNAIGFRPVDAQNVAGLPRREDDQEKYQAMLEAANDRKFVADLRKFQKATLGIEPDGKFGNKSMLALVKKFDTELGKPEIQTAFATLAPSLGLGKTGGKETLIAKLMPPTREPVAPSPRPAPAALDIAHQTEFPKPELLTGQYLAKYQRSFSRFRALLADVEAGKKSLNNVVQIADTIHLYLGSAGLSTTEGPNLDQIRTDVAKIHNHREFDALLTRYLDPIAIALYDKQTKAGAGTFLAGAPAAPAAGTEKPSVTADRLQAEQYKNVYETFLSLIRQYKKYASPAIGGMYDPVERDRAFDNIVNLMRINYNVSHPWGLEDFVAKNQASPEDFAHEITAACLGTRQNIDVALARQKYTEYFANK